MRRRLKDPLLRIRWPASFPDASLASAILRSDRRSQSSAACAMAQPQVPDPIPTTSNEVEFEKRVNELHSTVAFTLLDIQAEAKKNVWASAANYSARASSNACGYRYSSALLTCAKEQHVPVIFRVFDRPLETTDLKSFTIGDDLRKGHSQPIVMCIDASDVSVDWRRGAGTERLESDNSTPLTLASPCTGTDWTFDLYSQHEIAAKLIASACNLPMGGNSLPHLVSLTLSTMNLHKGGGTAAKGEPFELLTVIWAALGFIYQCWFPCNLSPQYAREVTELAMRGAYPTSSTFEASRTPSLGPAALQSSGNSTADHKGTAFEWYRWASEYWQLPRDQGQPTNQGYDFNLVLKESRSFQDLRFLCNGNLYPKRFVNGDIAEDGVSNQVTAVTVVDTIFISALNRVLQSPEAATLGVPTRLEQLRFITLTGAIHTPRLAELEGDLPRITSNYTNIDGGNEIADLVEGNAETFIAHTEALRSLCRALVPSLRAWLRTETMNSSKEARDNASAAHTVLLAGMFRCEHELRSTVELSKVGSSIDRDIFTGYLFSGTGLLLQDITQGMQLALDALTAASTKTGKGTSPFPNARDMVAIERIRPASHAQWASGYLRDFLQIVEEADLVACILSTAMADNFNNNDLVLHALEFFDLLSHSALFAATYQSGIAGVSETFSSIAGKSHIAVQELLKRFPVGEHMDAGGTEIGSRPCAEPWHSLHRPFPTIIRSAIAATHENPYTEAMFTNSPNAASMQSMPAFSRLESNCLQILDGPLQDRVQAMRLICFADAIPNSIVNGLASDIARNVVEANDVIDRDAISSALCFDESIQRDCFYESDAPTADEGNQQLANREVARKQFLLDSVGSASQSANERSSDGSTRTKFTVAEKSVGRVMNTAFNLSNSGMLGTPIMADPHVARGMLAIQSMKSPWLPHLRQSAINKFPTAPIISGRLLPTYVTLRRAFLYAGTTLSSSGGQQFLRLGGLMPLFDSPRAVGRVADIWQVAPTAGAISASLGNSAIAVLIIRLHPGAPPGPSESISYQSPLYQSARIAACAKRNFTPAVINVYPILLSAQSMASATELLERAQEIQTVAEVTPITEHDSQPTSSAAIGGGRKQIAYPDLVEREILDGVIGDDEDEPVATELPTIVDAEPTAATSSNAPVSRGADHLQQLDRVADLLDTCSTIDPAIQGPVPDWNSEHKPPPTVDLLPFDRRQSNALRFTTCSTSEASAVVTAILGRVMRSKDINKVDEVAIVFKGIRLSPAAASTQEALWEQLHI